MGSPLFWVLLVSLLLVPLVVSEQEDVRRSLVDFLRVLSANDSQVEHDLGWSISTDPCGGAGWKGVLCNNRTNSTKRIVIPDIQLPGSIDASLLCKAPSLVYVSITGNSLHGGIPPEISECTLLTHLLLPGNGLSGTLPSSLAALNNLKKFDISDNSFSGVLPGDMGRISGLVVFLVQNNNLSGAIPQLHFSNLQQFNVSHNNFSGPVPADAGRFSLSSLGGNPGLCGRPPFPACPPPPYAPSEGKQKSPGREKLVMYLGYFLLGVAILVFSAYELTQKKRKKKEMAPKKGKEEDKVASESSTGKKSTATSMGSGGGHTAGRPSRSEYSITSSEGSAVMASSSLVVLRNPTTSAKELRLQDLLKAPAELVGRGRHGSVYKVMLNDETTAAVKRVKDGGVVPADEFRRRMERVDQVRHPGVLPALAFYCSSQEKLVVYEYQPRGSLLSLLHGSQNNGQAFGWRSRLSAAASICECLAFMHRELHADGIGHGNLKSSNVLMDAHMHPRISEYGLNAARSGTMGQPSLPVDNINGAAPCGYEGPFAADVNGVGVILLELLTGKSEEDSGVNLARWVTSVVREEWTGEVFDGALVREGAASEWRMVRLLQVALKCIGSSAEGRPGMDQVADMVNSIIISDEDEKSMVSEAAESMVISALVNKME